MNHHGGCQWYRSKFLIFKTGQIIKVYNWRGRPNPHWLHPRFLSTSTRVKSSARRDNHRLIKRRPGAAQILSFVVLPPRDEQRPVKVRIHGGAENQKRHPPRRRRAPHPVGRRQREARRADPLPRIRAPAARGRDPRVGRVHGAAGPLRPRRCPPGRGRGRAGRPLLLLLRVLRCRRGTPAERARRGGGLRPWRACGDVRRPCPRWVQRRDIQYAPQQAHRVNYASTTWGFPKPNIKIVNLCKFVTHISVWIVLHL